MKIEIADTSHESLGIFSNKKVNKIKKEKESVSIYTGDYIIEISSKDKEYCRISY